MQALVNHVKPLRCLGRALVVGVAALHFTKETLGISPDVQSLAAEFDVKQGLALRRSLVVAHRSKMMNPRRNFSSEVQSNFCLHLELFLLKSCLASTSS